MRDEDEERSRAANVPVVLVMGVAGSGKTSVGEGLARRLGVPFLEGDRFHPPASVEKMRSGNPLDDADRQPWLESMAAALAEARRMHGAVLACSALRRRYRDLLRGACPELRIVFLSGTPAEIAPRLAARKGHYMPASLLDSQFETLEPPAADEPHARVGVDQPIATAVEAALSYLATAETGS